MKKRRGTAIILFFLLLTGNAIGQQDDYGLKKSTIPVDELMRWTALGQGKAERSGAQIAMQESDDSQGFMIVSPEPFPGDIIIRYKTLALTAATVLVAMISVSDIGESENLTIPDNYDGGMGLLMGQRESYFFAFKNAPHSNNTPFVRKSPNPSGNLGASNHNDNMVAGIYYDIEIGKHQGKLWLSVNGDKLFEAEDENPLQGGHVALRIRGTAGFRAGCLIKDLVILNNE